MTEKKDRRSRVEKLRDGIIEDIERRIQEIQVKLEERNVLNELDSQMARVLREQIVTINKLSKKNGKGEDN
ncbi:MAG: hypothetical protein V3U84_07790, partial [Thiotrichaceae bacterium]